MTVYLTREQILEIHRRVLEAEGRPCVGDDVLNRDRFESAVLAPMQSGFGVDFYPTFAEKAAALFRGLLCDHPFNDGNKRTAFVALTVFLDANDGRPIFADLADHHAWVVAYAKRCAALTVEEIAEDLTLRMMALG